MTLTNQPDSSSEDRKQRDSKLNMLQFNNNTFYYSHLARLLTLNTLTKYLGILLQ